MSEDKKKVVFPQFELASCPTFDLKAAMEYLETGDDAVFETAVDTVTGKKLSKGFVLAMLPLARRSTGTRNGTGQTKSPRQQI
jgi:hypothetical protein